MAFKQFSFNIIIRVFFICTTVFLLMYIYLNSTLYATITILCILVILQTYLLIKFVSKTNKEIIRFFDSIKYSDFSQSFSSKIKGASFEELSNSFSAVMKKFQSTRSEKEENYRYLQTVIQHIGIGLITFTSDGNIDLINNSAKKLLGINVIKNIKELSLLDKKLPKKLLSLKSGDKFLQKIVDNNELIQLVIYAAEFRMRGKQYILISLQNIQSELEDVEIEAWQKLIKVLTHEIMNSVTPITSLAATADDILKDYESKSDGINDTLKENLDDVRGAVNTIQKRSDGLLNFVAAYRNLTKVPIPNFSLISIESLFQNIETLFTDEVSKRNIKFTKSIIPKNLEITADSDQIEQILINLVQNSIYALDGKENPKIDLKAYIDKSGHGVIQVSDNGPGISKEIMGKIFIPFYTTRKGGSGIGLSLSQQIMRAHRGSIRVVSSVDDGTTFTLRF